MANRPIPTLIEGTVEGVEYTISDDTQTLTIVIPHMENRKFQRHLYQKMYGRPKRVIERAVMNFVDSVYQYTMFGALQ